MKKMDRCVVGRMVAGLAIALAAWVATPQVTIAQSADAQSCRCVDANGDRVDNCSCFRAPNVRSVFTFGQDATVVRPRIGISVDHMQSARNDRVGVRVTDVLEDGPADDAGLEVGDIITSIGGHSVFDALDEDTEERFNLDQSIPVQRLLAIARELEPGDEVEVEYIRDDETYTATVEAEDLDWQTSVLAPGWNAGELSDRMRDLTDRMRTWEFTLGSDDRANMELLEERLHEVQPRSFFTPGGNLSILGDGDASVVVSGIGGGWGTGMSRIAGVEFMDMKAQLADFFGAEQGGVLVTDVDEDSQLGVEAGDVVLRVGQRAVTSASHLQRILRSYAPDEEITLRVLRDGEEATVTGRLD